MSSTSQVVIGGKDNSNSDGNDIPIPMDELQEYRYEDHWYETSAELESKLRTFPRCRLMDELQEY